MATLENIQTEEQRKKAFADAGIINTAALTPATPITIPTPATPSLSSLNAINQGALAGANYTMDYEQNPYYLRPGETIDAYNVRIGGTQTPAKEPIKEEGETKSFSDKLKEYLGMSGAPTDLTAVQAGLPKPVSAVAEYQKQMEMADMQTKQASVSNLKKQLASLSAQQQSLQLEYGLIPERMQQEAAGRGITEAGLAPHTAGELRKKALEMMPITQQILGVSAQLAGEQGDVENAMANINTMLNLQEKDRTSQWDYWSKIYDMAIKVADKEDAKRLNEVKDKTEAEKKEADDFADLKSTYIDAAIKERDFATASKIAILQIGDESKLQELVGGITAKQEVELRQIGDNLIELTKDATGRVISQRVISSKREDVGVVEEQLYSGLSSATATAVRSRVGKFATEPIIQNFATIQDGYNFSSSISDITTNPADDQALIYSLAKALDPGSVVREGEYATAQKYAQSWVKAYGKGVTQALLGTGFLSEEARKNIKKTIEQKYEASKKSYEHIYFQYEKGINALTGRKDGSEFLTEYAITPEEIKQNEMSNDEAYNEYLKLSGQSVSTSVQQKTETTKPKSVGSMFGEWKMPTFNISSWFK